MKNSIKASLFLYILFLFSCQPKKIEKFVLSENIVPNSSENRDDQYRIDTIFNSSNILILGNSDQVKIEVNKKEDIRKEQKHVSLFQYNDSTLVAYGIDKISDIEIFRKYNPSKSFDDFQVPIYQGKLKAPNFSTTSFQHRKELIIETCKEGINFGGHYTIVEWMCGSDCQICVVVDRITGQIFEGCGSGNGISFKKNSILLIKDIGAIDEDNLVGLGVSNYVELLIWDTSKFTIFEKFYIDLSDLNLE